MRPHLFAAALGACLLLSLTPHYAGAQPQPPVGDLREDALTPPPPPPTLSSGLASRGPSQYMAGDVAVQVLLPQTNDTEHAWSEAQIDQIHSQIQSALDWWVARLPLARLSFTVRMRVVPSAYEPIDYSLMNEGLWIGDVLRNLGYMGGSYFDQAYAADYALRDELGADWATTIFVVNSDGDGDGSFPDGRFAYAYINGPFMVLTSDVASYGAAQIGPVVAHEFAHIFGALDQYAAAGVACTQVGGYLSVPTTNSQYNGCGTGLPSIMREVLDSFRHGQIDPSALAQLGYRDSDGDGLIDPLDTAPELTLDPMLLAAPGGRPLLSGLSRDIGFPSPTHQDASINAMSVVEYRVDGGLWLPAEATDGAYDSGDEGFGTALPLYDGDYLIEARARNSVGGTSSIVSGRVTVSQVGPQPDYTPSLPPFTQSADVQVRLGAPQGTQSVQISAEPAFSGAVWQRYSPELPFRLDHQDGEQVIYVRYRDAAGLPSLPFALSVMLDTLPPSGSASQNPDDPGRLILNASDAGAGVADVGIQIGANEPLWLSYQPNISLAGLADLTSAPAPSASSIHVLFRDAAGNTSSPCDVTSGVYRAYLPLVVR